MIPVNEIFQSIQGEGAYTGTPSIFIRSQGCGVGCPWCDTKHTWKVDGADRISFADMFQKIVDKPTFSEVDETTLVDHIKGMPEGHVVITGGEPANHDLGELTSLLVSTGRSVQIETSGTSEIKVHEKTFVTLSPKINMPGGLRVRGDAVKRADEIKMPIGRQRDIDKLNKFLVEFDVPKAKKIWLQPISQSAKAGALCLQVAAQGGWYVSVQAHKYLGVR